MILESFRSLTKFERNLWITSIITVTCSYLFLPEKDYVNLIASLIGVTSLIFIAKGHVLGQVFGLCFCILYGFISYFFHYYGEMITYMCMTGPMALLSIISWIKHPYEDSSEVQVKKVTKFEIILLTISTILVTIIFYFILKYFNTPNLFFSTISISTSFYASALSFLRSPYYALAYSCNDIVLIVLWILASFENIAYFPMVICFVMFFINDIYGYYNWIKMMKRQEK